MIEQVYNENNIHTGWYVDDGNNITYHSTKHGHLGTYDKVRKQYYRAKPYPGGPYAPWPGTDWGITDIMYWDKQP